MLMVARARNLLLQAILIAGLAAGFALSAPLITFAQTYGECAYGEYNYGDGCTPESSSGKSGGTSKRTTPVLTTGSTAAAPSPITPAPSGPSFSFSQDLDLGATAPDVLALQKFLNTAGYTVSAFGAGSAGQETDYFGPATKAALARYQASKGITPAVGTLGPITRASINGSVAPATTPTPTGTFTRDLELNMTGEDVRALQQYLNAKGYTVAVSGPGSVGNETNLFGPATQAAVIVLQKENGITPAIGYFGPITRAYVASH